MKKILLITALFSIATCYVAAQSDNHSTAGIATDTVANNTTIATPPDDDNESSSNLLSDFLTFLAKKNKGNSTKRDNGNAQWHEEEYFNYGFVVGSVDGNAAELIMPSYSIGFGLKYRYQVSGIYSVTLSFGFLHNRYKMKNGIANNVFGEASTLYDDYVVSDERFRTWALSFGIGNRFYFDKHHRSKLYLELGAYGSYVYSHKYLAQAQMRNNANPHISMSIKYKDSALFNPFEAGLEANLGMFNWLTVRMQYRLTDWFYTKNTHAKLPPITVGIGLVGF